MDIIIHYTIAILSIYRYEIGPHCVSSPMYIHLLKCRELEAVTYGKETLISIDHNFDPAFKVSND